MLNKNVFTALCLFCAVLFAALIGCTSKKEIGTISGSVKIDGKALDDPAKVVINFMNKATGRGNGAFLNPDGAYFVDKLEVGDYLVAISPGTAPPMGPDAPKQPKIQIPEPYWDLNSSGLNCAIKKGPNIYDIELTVKKK